MTGTNGAETDGQPNGKTRRAADIAGDAIDHQYQVEIEHIDGVIARLQKRKERMAFLREDAKTKATAFFDATSEAETDAGNVETALDIRENAS